MKGQRITLTNHKLMVPDYPIIPFIEGDGTGPDIWAASVKVFNAAVERPIMTGRSCGRSLRRKAYNRAATSPEETPDHCECLVAIVADNTRWGGIVPNVALRQILDLYVCLRPVKYFEGVPSPVKDPTTTNMVIFRENAEDIYAGIEWMSGTPEAKKVITFLRDEMKVQKIRFPESSSIGIKPVSKEGTERLVDRFHMRFSMICRLPHKISKIYRRWFPRLGLPVVKNERRC
jgi:isocitrate dehydrogenase